MVSPNPESTYSKVIPHPGDKTFRNWLLDDPHFFRLADNDNRRVQRIIRILDHPTLLSQVNPDSTLTHDDRLAIIIRHIGEIYPSEQDIFDVFGVNRRTLHTFTMTAREPVVAPYYTRVHEVLTEMYSRREQAKQRRLERRRQARESTAESLAEFAQVEVTT